MEMWARVFKRWGTSNLRLGAAASGCVAGSHSGAARIGGSGNPPGRTFHASLSIPSSLSSSRTSLRPSLSPSSFPLSSSPSSSSRSPVSPRSPASTSSSPSWSASLPSPLSPSSPSSSSWMYDTIHHLQRRHKSTIVLAEHDGKSVSQATCSAVTAAKQLNERIIGIVTGKACEEAGEDFSKVEGVDEVIVSDDAKLDHFMADSTADFLIKMVKANESKTLVAPISSIGRDIMPRVGAQMDIQPISDVIKIESPDTFCRFMYAGNIMSRIRSKEKINIMTIRPTAFPPSKKREEGQERAKMRKIDFDGSPSQMKFIGEEREASDLPQLATAKVVVAGGRALKNKDEFQKILEPLRAKLNAALGASRAAVDSGFCANDLQVGQTGKVVAPSLYIAIGISGAIQHLSGMKDSKIIVAINKDAEAPIFQVANYGLVGDLYSLVPELTAKLNQQ